MKLSEKILLDHWQKATDKPMDETTRQHLQWVVNAIEEALNIPLPDQGNFYCAEWNKVGYCCDNGQCEKCETFIKNAQ